jgi:hypothetical protein
MCFVLEDSGVAALNSFIGDTAASSSLANSLHRLETLCEDIVQILGDQENGTGTKEEVVDANSKETATHLQDSIPVAGNGEQSETGEIKPSTVKPEARMETKPSIVKSDDKMEIDG